MKIFKKKEQEIKVSSNFRGNVRKAISIILLAPESATDKDILELFEQKGIARADSIELLIFLPIAFLRKLFDVLKWHESYFELDHQNNQVEKKFTDSVSFQIVWQETEKYFQHLPISKEVMKIAARSAEFNVINDLLLQNPETKAEDIVLSKLFIVR